MDNFLFRLVLAFYGKRARSKPEDSSTNGFTLIELLVVIIIVGILASIALPSFLNQAQKARFAEAKSYILTMSRLQQAYFLEKRSFADDIANLNLGVNTASGSYTYSVLPGDINGALAPQELRRIITNRATPTSNAIKAMVSVVGIPGPARIDTIFCVANLLGTNPTLPGSVDIPNQALACPAGFSLQEN
ncbi:MAG: type IV pilin-like G/H family protein [Pseudanabaenaceae cyanobacterium bins.68]|nr:type IV pilin-like G/H family protein [Pseudanabaenaceae cyanobacterium bins.68]